MDNHVSLQGLRQCLRGYSDGLRNDYHSYAFGKWKIAEGGYDLAWSLRYDWPDHGLDVVSCISGPYDNYGFLENNCLPVDDFVRVYLTVASEYSDVRLHPDTLAQYPELSQKLDLFKVLTEEDQRDWEHEHHISIADDQVLQKIAQKLDRYNIVLERNSENPTLYDIGFPFLKPIDRIWYTVSMNDGLTSFDESVKKEFKSFDIDGFINEWVADNQTLNSVYKDNGDMIAAAVTNVKIGFDYVRKNVHKIIKEQSKSQAR